MVFGTMERIRNLFRKSDYNPTFNKKPASIIKLVFMPSSWSYGFMCHKLRSLSLPWNNHVVHLVSRMNFHTGITGK